MANNTVNEMSVGTLELVRGMVQAASSMITLEDKLVLGALTALLVLMMGFSAWLVGMGIKAACSGSEHPTHGPTAELALARRQMGIRNPRCKSVRAGQPQSGGNPFTATTTTNRRDTRDALGEGVDVDEDVECSDMDLRYGAAMWTQAEIYAPTYFNGPSPDPCHTNIHSGDLAHRRTTYVPRVASEGGDAGRDMYSLLVFLTRVGCSARSASEGSWSDDLTRPQSDSAVTEGRFNSTYVE